MFLKLHVSQQVINALTHTHNISASTIISKLSYSYVLVRDWSSPNLNRFYGFFYISNFVRVNPLVYSICLFGCREIEDWIPCRNFDPNWLVTQVKLTWKNWASKFLIRAVKHCELRKTLSWVLQCFQWFVYETFRKIDWNWMKVECLNNMA